MPPAAPTISLVVRNRLKTVIARLPHQQRLAVLLHYADGLSWAEIASVLGVEPSSVAAWLEAARRRLAAELESSSLV